MIPVVTWTTSKPSGTLLLPDFPEPVLFFTYTLFPRISALAGITRAFSELSRMIFASTFMPGRRLPVSSRVTVTG